MSLNLNDADHLSKVVISVKQGGTLVASRTIEVPSASSDIPLDAFFTLPPGSYEIDVVPYDANGDVSATCEPASTQADVIAGATTEVQLVLLCGETDNGGLDVVITTAHAPVIKELAIEPSKFVHTCESTEVAITATDADGDQLELAWSVVSRPEGTAPHPAPGRARELEANGSVASFATATAGDFTLRVDVTDPSGKATGLTFPVHVLPGGVCEGKQRLTGHVRAEFVNPVGPVPDDQMISLAIGSPVRDAQGLDAFITSVTDPSSADFRRYLTPLEFTQRFAPTESDSRAIVTWATTHGLTASATPNRLLVDVTGTAKDINRALFVTLSIYRRADGTLFFAPDREPSLDTAAPVLHISGLDDFVRPIPVGGSAADGGYLSRDLRNAYTSCSTMTGAGESVGIFAFEGFDPVDVAAYQAAAGLPAIPARAVLLNGVSGAAGPNNLEVSLDIDMAMSLAPGLSEVVVFEGRLPNDIMNAMATSTPLSNQLSSSWFFGVDANTQQIVNTYAAQGQSFYQASGDSGGVLMDPTGVHDLNNMSFVGGTVLQMSGAGASYTSEAGWSGSSGGVLTNVPLPGFQSVIDVTTNGGSTLNRNFPDVAMPAQNISIIASGLAPDGITRVPGQVFNVGGTSASAPLWASFTALVNQASRATGLGTIGYANPTLYAIGRDAPLYLTNFNDISTGSNGPFAAGTGYDLVTGLGSPKCNLIGQLASISPTAPLTFPLIQFTVGTGNDNLGDHGSGAVAELFATGAATPIQTVTLKARDGSTWSNGSVHEVTLPLDEPIVGSGVGRITLRLLQDSCDLSCDNWTVQSFEARLVRPGGGPQQCLIDLHGGATESDAVARLKFGSDVDHRDFTVADGCP